MPLTYLSLFAAISPAVGHASSVTSCSWSPDGGTLASASRDGTVKLWEVASGRCTATFAGHENWVGSCSWSPDGGTLASASHDGTVKLWEVASGRCTATLAGHDRSVRFCSWSPDGGTLASASADRTVKLWEVESGRERMTLLNSSTDQCAAIDLAGNEVVWAAANAWRILGWRYRDPASGMPAILPAEYFGPLR